MSFEDYKDVHLQAFQLGCKGRTTYRASEIRGYVLKINRN
jgi:ribonucleoside-diphosphate reductase alpha chain